MISYNIFQFHKAHGECDSGLLESACTHLHRVGEELERNFLFLLPHGVLGRITDRKDWRATPSHLQQEMMTAQVSRNCVKPLVFRSSSGSTAGVALTELLDILSARVSKGMG